MRRGGVARGRGLSGVGCRGEQVLGARLLRLVYLVGGFFPFSLAGRGMMLHCRLLRLLLLKSHYHRCWLRVLVSGYCLTFLEYWSRLLMSSSSDGWTQLQDL